MISSVDKTAGELSDLSTAEVITLIEDCLFREYIIGIENKNLRLIVRSIDAVENEELIKNIIEIQERIHKLAN